MPDELATIAPETQEPGPSEGQQTEQVTAEGATETPGAEEAPVSQEAQPTEPDWTRIAELDPTELLQKHPRLQGKYGELAEKQTKKALAEARRAWEAEQAQREAEREAARKQEELDRLIEDDPATYIEKVKEGKDQAKAHEEALKREWALRESTWGEVDMTVLHPLFYELPRATQEALQGKEYPGNPVESRLAYVRDIIKEHARLQSDDVTRKVDEAVKKAREDWEKKDRPTIREALRKELLAELNGGEPAPDTGSGTPTGRAITWEEVERHRGDQRWFNEHYEEINAGISRR